MIILDRLRRSFAERRLHRLNAQLEAHCETCATCAVAAWGNRAQRRRTGNPKFCHRAQPILLAMDETLVRVRQLYGMTQ